MKCPECGKEIYPMVLPHCQTGTFKTPLLDEMERGAWPCFVVSGSGVDDPLVAVNQKELVALRAERDKYKAALEEIRDHPFGTPPWSFSSSCASMNRIAMEALEDAGPKTKPPPTPKPSTGMKCQGPGL